MRFRFSGRRSRDVVLSASFTCAIALGAAPALGEPLEATTFEDGPRHVEVVRRGPARETVVRATPGLATPLTEVELHYAGRPAVHAVVDETTIVTIDPTADPIAARAALAEAGVEVLRPLMPAIGLYLAHDTTGGDGIDASARLSTTSARRRGVRAAIPNLHVHVRTFDAVVPDDPKLASQWYFDNIHMTDAWGLSEGAPTSTILVIDTGCDMAHEDLVAKMDPGRDVIDEDDDPSAELSEDGSFHGTACAGIAAAATDNAIGIAGGCPECRLRCVRLINDTALPMSKNIEAYQYALDIDAAVVSNSWGFVEAFPVPQALADAINQVFDHGRGGRGAPVVFAMGNDDREVGADELLGVRGVLGVGAINNLDETTSFTNSGSVVDVVAPTGTLTTDLTGSAGNDPGNYTSLFGGTSSACPVVAGIMGLMVGAAPAKTAQELYDALIETTRTAPFANPDSKGHDALYGYGIVDPVPALHTVMGLSTGAGGAGGEGGAGVKNDGSGCSCEVTGDGKSRVGVWLLMGAIALAFGRARRPASRAR